MPATSRLNSRSKAALWAAVPLVIFIPLLLWLGEGFERRLAEEERTRTRHTLELHAASLQRALDRIEGKLETLETFVIAQTAGGATVDAEQFNLIATGLFASSQWVRAFQIVSNGIITHTYPFNGNETVVGYNLLADPRPTVAADVTRALTTGKITVTGPVPLVQGGLGIIIRKPVGRAPSQPGRLVAVVLNIAPLMADSGFAETSTNNVQLALRRDTGEVFYGLPAVFQRDPVTQRLTLPDGYWEIGAVSQSDHRATSGRSIELFYLAGGIIIVLMWLLVFIVARRQSELKETVQERTRELNNELTERKQAEERVRHLNRVYAVLSDINQTIVREKDPQKMLSAACQIAVEKGRFRMAWIGLAEAPARRVKLVAHAGADPETLKIVETLLEKESTEESCSFTIHALETGRPAVCNDIAQDPQAAHWRVAALERDYRAMASLPLKAETKVIGTFNLYAGELWFFDAEEMRLLDELALDISFALKVYERERERERAEAALRDSTRQLRALTARMETLREQERVHISREIHDELGQKLTALKMDLHWLENRLPQITDEALRTVLEDKIVTASAAADETMTAVQRISAELRPAMLDNLGLIATLRHEAKQFEGRTGIPVNLSLPKTAVTLSTQVSTTVYRIFQEVLTNVMRHARASEVKVNLEVSAGQLRLRVEDNGVGVSSQNLHSPESLGLLGMSERAAMVNGSIRIQGMPGRGTTVHLEIPIENPAAPTKHSFP